MQTISECDVQNAFRPHPERPIYTVRAPELLEETKVFTATILSQDADREHVQIRDLALEIVDLR